MHWPDKTFLKGVKGAQNSHFDHFLNQNNNLLLPSWDSVFTLYHQRGLQPHFPAEILPLTLFLMPFGGLSLSPP